MFSYFISSHELQSIKIFFHKIQGILVATNYSFQTNDTSGRHTKQLLSENEQNGQVTFQNSQSV